MKLASFLLKPLVPSLGELFAPLAWLCPRQPVGGWADPSPASVRYRDRRRSRNRRQRLARKIQRRSR